ncbi:MAG: phosphoserine phosphatase SerB [Hyphomicrobiales bacterium]
MSQQTHVITLISHPDHGQITDRILNDLADHLGRKLDVTQLADGIACDIPVNADEATQAALIAPQLDQQRIDMAIQPIQGRRKTVLIADMDSTMIEQECIDELADAIGIKDKVSDITARAMRGEIEFDPALRERVGLLKDLDLSIIDEVVRDKITLRTGGRELVQTMKAKGGYTALVSGGFTMFTARIAEMLGFDENRANTLEVDGNQLSGTVADPILGSAAKVTALEEICAMKGLTPSDVMAIGDGANDLGMIELAGAGIAVHAKPKVAAAADMAINHGDLTALLYLQGYSKADFVR